MSNKAQRVESRGPYSTRRIVETIYIGRLTWGVKIDHLTLRGEAIINSNCSVAFFISPNLCLGH